MELSASSGFPFLANDLLQALLRHLSACGAKLARIGNDLAGNEHLDLSQSRHMLLPSR
jgi:hypothetical protein